MSVTRIASSLSRRIVLPTESHARAPVGLPQARAELIDTYKQEIDQLIADSHTQDAIPRILDFAKQFAREAELVTRAILLSARYEDFRKQKRIETDYTKLSSLQQHMRNDILELNLDIQSQAQQPEEVPSNVDSSPSPPLRLVPSEDDEMPAGAERTAFETNLDRARRSFLDSMRSGGDAESSDVVFRGTDIGQSYKRRFRDFALKGASLELHPGDIVGLVGVNGSGKTTLLNIVRGALRADEGKLEYPALSDDPEAWADIRRQIAFVPQHLKRWPGYVVDNLHYWAAQFGIYGRENEADVEWLLHRLDLSDFRRARWGDLSGGYRMRFALAKALLSRPRLLVLDEPLAHLDIIAQQLFLRDLKDIALSPDRPVPILVSSQHLYEVESIADTVLFLNNGRIVFQGSLAELERQRTDNFVELSSSMSREDMGAALAHLGDVRVEPVGLYTLLTLPLEASVDSALRDLTDKGGRLRYFRDISGSTVNLFRAQAQREEE